MRRLIRVWYPVGQATLPVITGASIGRVHNDLIQHTGCRRTTDTQTAVNNFAGLYSSRSSPQNSTCILVSGLSRSGEVGHEPENPKGGAFMVSAWSVTASAPTVVVVSGSAAPCTEVLV